MSAYKRTSLTNIPVVSMEQFHNWVAILLFEKANRCVPSEMEIRTVENKIQSIFDELLNVK